MSFEEIEAVSLRFLRSWRKEKRQFISIDADTFSRYFSYLPVHVTIHDKTNQNPVFIVVDRVLALTVVSNRHDLKTKDNFPSPQKN